MSKARKIKISSELCKQLEVSEEVINSKIEHIVSKRVNGDEASILDAMGLITDYRSSFSKDELIALLFTATSEAGVFRFRFAQLLSSGMVDKEQVIALFTGDFPSDDDIVNMFSEDDDDWDDDGEWYLRDEDIPFDEDIQDEDFL